MAKKKGSSKSKSALARRQFILEQANLHGVVSFGDIAKKGFSTGWQSLKGDATFFAAMKLGVELRKGRFVLRGRDVDVKSTYEDRKTDNPSEKGAIGELASALIWGTKCASFQRPPYVSPCRDMILAQLEDRGRDVRTPNWSPSVAAKLRDHLGRYWAKKHRHCVLDAGTTTDSIAEHLAKKDAPDSDAGLAALTIVTNAPTIEGVLQKTLPGIDVIVVGGELRKDTLSHTGRLCEQCLNAWEIQVDIAMVGTTSLDYPHGRQVLCFACDSASEARTKGLLLERADLRCVVMDSSKCGRYRSSAFIFASASEQFIDFVITDKGIHDWVIIDGEIRHRTTMSDAIGKGEKVWDALHNAGVVVFVAESYG